jgi:hypothetical protein
VLILIGLSALSAIAQSTLISVFKSPSVSCDYLIVCPKQFLGSAQRLASFRNTFSGDDVGYARVVDLATLDNEFPTGDTIPRCCEIWYAMKYARMQWTIAPKYLVLIGDDSVSINGFDSLSFPKSAGLMPTCYLRADTTSYNGSSLDTEVIYTDFLYWTITDSSSFAEGKGGYRYVPLNFTLAPFSVGRIPARTAAECSAYVEKVISFENRNGARLWYNNAILCADDRMQGLIPDQLGWAHLESCEIISDKTLMGFFQKKVYLSSFLVSAADSHDDARNAYFSDVNSGARWCVYFGHGHPDSLTSEGFLRTNDVGMFTNDTTPTMFFSFSCSNGDYLRKPVKQMCRAYLFKSTGGCISYFAASRESYAYDNECLAVNLFSQDSGSERLSLGEAVSNAFALSRDDNMASYHIFGDPALTFIKRKAALSPSISVDANGLLTFSGNVAASSSGQLYYCCEISYPETTLCIDTIAGPVSKYLSDSVLIVKEGLLNGPVSAKIPANFTGDKIKFTFYACNAEFEARYDTVVVFNVGTHNNVNAAVASGPSVRFIRGIVTVSFLPGLSNEPPQLSIFDLRGRLCQSVAMQSRNSSAFFDFHGTHLSEGNYILRVAAAGRFFTQKVFFLR